MRSYQAAQAKLVLPCKNCISRIEEGINTLVIRSKSRHVASIRASRAGETYSESWRQFTKLFMSSEICSFVWQLHRLKSRTDFDFIRLNTRHLEQFPIDKSHDRS